MKNAMARSMIFAIVASGVLTLSAGASAQAQRTFVASTGDDASPLCTFAQPCRSFAAALTQTNSGGEIVVIDSAGYGVVTIAQSVSIIAAPGVYAGISVFTGNGVTVTGVGSRVRLSGLTINGQGGDIGIHFQQGAKLAVDHCTMSDLNLYGLYVQAANSTWIVTDTTVNGNAIYGIIAEAGSGSLDRVRVENNFNVGILVNTTSNVLVRALIRNSVASGNAGHGISVFTGSGRTAIVTVENSSAFLNGGSGFAGVTSGGTTVLTLRFVDATANAGSGAIATGAGATVGITGSTLVRNTNFGMEQTDGSLLRSLQNNTVEDNVAGATSGGITNSTPI
jgi:hypothetical protein